MWNSQDLFRISVLLEERAAQKLFRSIAAINLKHHHKSIMSSQGESLLSILKMLFKNAGDAVILYTELYISNII